MAERQRFCCVNHRTYFHREGLSVDDGADRPRREHYEDDTSIATALQAAQMFTPVPIADHKTVAAIRVERKGADPVTWDVKVPSNSAVAATRIYEALTAHIGDLLTLANKLGAAAGEPLLVIGTRRKR
jgi:hypothetical protein